MRLSLPLDRSLLRVGLADGLLFELFLPPGSPLHEEWSSNGATLSLSMAASTSFEDSASLAGVALCLGTPLSSEVDFPVWCEEMSEADFLLLSDSRLCRKTEEESGSFK